MEIQCKTRALDQHFPTNIGRWKSFCSLNGNQKDVQSWPLKPLIRIWISRCNHVALATSSRRLRLRGGWFRNRNDFADAVDFIGWYNHLSRRELGLAANDARNLYLAYYHGRGGYKRGAHKRDAHSPGYAAKVAARAAQYRAQQAKCPKPPSRFWR